MIEDIEIIHVVAMDQQQCIGKNNDLPWHISADLQHFKKITQGGVVVMGRKTLESMGRCLPKRVNWVITRDQNWSYNGAKVGYSIDEVLHLALTDVKQSEQPHKLFIIGGAEIFKQTIEYADRLELTHVHVTVEQGEAFYPKIPSHFEKITNEHHTDHSSGIEFEFASYTTSLKSLI
ncbi:dihydrofolate reductase [Acinetobacter sp. B5B]|uniref:dihydrofolate reductase n=1 Tax=Acinetobacter baretiae TaxID=2605383 RepID=UPI0018C30DE1|nr:dihydrofolate reductase [Acinetobacter baretiae]MBF7683299.1 dihydrofolate reductase [Acinetobacter baretiae]